MAFGHRRLSILDLTEAADQPMLTADGSGVLAYNGEVYNYRELRQELERERVNFAVRAIPKWCFRHCIIGASSSALRNSTGCSRSPIYDRRGERCGLHVTGSDIKPLACRRHRKRALCGSEAKALLAHPCMETRAARSLALAKWILQVVCRQTDACSPASMRSSLARLEVTEKGIEKHRYFHALTAVDVNRLVGASAENPTSLVSEFRDHLERSVSLHLGATSRLRRPVAAALIRA